MDKTLEHKEILKLQSQHAAEELKNNVFKNYTEFISAAKEMGSILFFFHFKKKFHFFSSLH